MGMVRFNAVILAGQREGEQDKVAQAAGVSCKALAPVNGKPMLSHVIDTLQNSALIKDIHVIGPKETAMDNVTLHDPEQSPCLSLLRVFSRIEKPFIVTTADHVLLDKDMIDMFLGGFDDKADLSVGMVPLSIVQQKYPGARRTGLKFRGGACKACNLFGLHSDKARLVLEYWKNLEAKRKSPLSLAASLGPYNVLKYLLGFLTLEEAFQKTGRLTGAVIRPVMLSDADAAIDVDSVDDYEFVKDILGSR